MREALAVGAVTEIYLAESAVERYTAMLAGSTARVHPVTDAGLAALTETVTPQGIVAVCRFLDAELPAVPRLVTVLDGVSDPGNAGTVLRCADAAGGDAVVFPDDTVDPYNGKCVRASVGSLFHLPIRRGGDTGSILAQLRSAGAQVLAADAHGDTDLDDVIDAGVLRRPTVWLFGSEAHGLPESLAGRADARVRVPIHGAAESLNLATAAAVCLYASARELRKGVNPGHA